MMKEIKQNEKGFTLVELVVVIAILAVLAALLVPRIIGNVNDARESQELADARTIASEVTTHNAVARVENDPTNFPTIPTKLVKSHKLVDSELTPIGRGSNETLKDMKAFQVLVDIDGNATVAEVTVTP